MIMILILLRLLLLNLLNSLVLFFIFLIVSNPTVCHIFHFTLLPSLFRWRGHILNFLTKRSFILDHSDVEREVDYISELPDCILSDIQSMISMKDMMNTSILSKRWCNLWHLRRDLQFDVRNVFGSKEQVLKEGYLVIEKKDHEKLKRRASDECRDEFVRRVDQFVKNFKGTEIDSFMVEFCLNDEHSKSIDEWIRFAITRGVGRIDLLLYAQKKSSYHHYNEDNEDSGYKFPFGLSFDQCDKYSTTLKYMHLRFCCLVYHPTNFDIFPFTNLRSLKLVKSVVDVNMLTALLSNCLLFEELSLFTCVLRSNSSTLKIESSSLCHLKLDHCFGNENESLELISLDCPKLTSFYYYPTRHSDSILSMNTPILKTIYYFDWHDKLDEMFALLATLTKLEILNLYYFGHYNPYICLEQEGRVLQNLRELNLSVDASSDFDTSWIFIILQGSPSLQKLSVMITYPVFHKNERDSQYLFDIQDLGMFSDVMFSHDEIKVIELGGCVGNRYEIEFAMNALKYIHSLERIVLSPDWIDKYSRSKYSNIWTCDPTWSQNGREIILEKLRAEGIELDKLVLK
ncbi:F-box/FBD/LRR-repeat protein At1g13570-like [Lotus japonicus]|uniref:F-box/FBD/LRR-repeat protein At1g13570-like n=1 Tax=Lotus japonicus TaxID=34305 RepID=UPI00258D8DE8|nr:F-box/FBD/LRR-repeat protein At1g13570-like [Lotus japonicus]